MMEVYKTPSKEIQEIILANVTYETVIDGLNGYFASEPRNGYITIRGISDDRDSLLYETEAWADILITWLRTEHGIFYYPGMEAKYAKSEKIPPLTERLMDEGALNSLKKLHKRVTGKEPEVISHTLIADGISHAVSVKETQIEELKTHINLLRYDLWDSDTKDLMNYIRKEASRNGFNLPEEIDDEPLTVKLTVKMVFHDLLELLRQHESKIRNAERETRKAVNEQLKKDTNYVADALSTILEALGISKSDTVHLDIFGLKTKAIQRASVIKSEHDRYLEQLDKAAADYQALNAKNQELKIELNAIKDTVSQVRSRLNRKFISLPGYEDDLEKLADIALRAVEARDETIDRITRPWYDEREDAKKEAKQECYKYLWDALKALSPDCDALKITDYEKLVDRIFYEMSLVEGSCKECRRKQSTEKFDYIQRTNKAEEETKKLKEQLDKAAADPESRGKVRAEIENYKLKLKDYILKGIKKHGYRYDGLENKSIEEIVGFIIAMATCPRNEWAKDEIENLRGQISRLKDLINAMNEEVGDM